MLHRRSRTEPVTPFLSDIARMHSPPLPSAISGMDECNLETTMSALHQAQLKHDDRPPPVKTEWRQANAERLLTDYRITQPGYASIKIYRLKHTWSPASCSRCDGGIEGGMKKKAKVTRKVTMAETTKPLESGSVIELYGRDGVIRTLAP
ncbi:hypothetical protein EMIT051CA3_90010 [Pseudomonas chlororaphis]